MWYHNLTYFDGEGFVPGALQVEDGVFRTVRRGEDGIPSGIMNDGKAIDLAGALVIPGLVDIHVHGAAGADFSDGDEEGLRRMARHLATRGVTSFLPTSATLPRDTLVRAFRTAAALRAQSLPGCARILGIHMEGPFLSAEKKGAQNADYLQAPDMQMFQELQKACGGMIRIVDVAPELEGAGGFIGAAVGAGDKQAAPCTVSLAHTAAAYEQAAAAFDAGARHLTHLFNAMPGIHHREPGVIGAAAEREQVTAELIADGYHVHPSAVRMAFRLFPGRICLVSDALRCCGMPEGEYEFGGQRIRLSGGVAWLAGRAGIPAATIAGAASDLMIDLRNAIAFGIPAPQAINAATIVPARVAGWADRIGSIEEGKYADFLICDLDLIVKQVVLGGERI